MPDVSKEEIQAYIDKHLPGATPADIRHYTLQPTKDAPVEFRGTLAAASNSKTNEGMARLCWYELAVYRTWSTTPKYILEISFQTLRRPQDNFKRVFVCDSAESLRQIIADYDEMAWIQGFPREEKYAVKQQRYEHEVRFHFRRAATEIFGQLSDQFPGDFIRRV